MGRKQLFYDNYRVFIVHTQQRFRFHVWKGLIFFFGDIMR